MLSRPRVLAVLALSLCAPLAAEAVPVRYDVTFSGANPGTGSFLWDADTTSFSGFTWDFGPGLIGGLRDSINWTTPVFGGTRGGYFFEVITGTNTHPDACGISASCGASFTSGDLVGYPSLVASFSRSLDVQGATYFLLGANSTIRSGAIIATPSPVTVAEPSALALLLLGGVGLALRVVRAPRSSRA